MGIKTFTITILILSLLSLINISREERMQIENEEIPQITFYDSKMYTLTQNRVIREVDAKAFFIYQNKEVMKDGEIITTVENDNTLKDIISAKEIIKKNELFTFIDDVKFDRSDIMSLRTQKLFYDQKDETLYNYEPFVGTFNGDTLKARDLFYDNKKGILNAKSSNFNININ